MENSLKWTNWFMRSKDFHRLSSGFDLTKISEFPNIFYSFVDSICCLNMRVEIFVDDLVYNIITLYMLVGNSILYAQHSIMHELHCYISFIENIYSHLLSLSMSTSFSIHGMVEFSIHGMVELRYSLIVLDTY